MRTVAAFNAQATVLAAFTRALGAPTAAAAEAARVSGFSQGFAQMMMNLPTAFVFYIGGIFITKGILTFQQVMQVFLALMMAVIGMSQVSAATGQVGEAGPSAVSLFQLIDRKPAIDSAGEGGLAPGADAAAGAPPPRGAMALRGVEFAYPQRPDALALRSLALDLPAGASTALVGESGSGKSTVVQLLLRARCVCLPGGRRWAAALAMAGTSRFARLPSLSSSAVLRPVRGRRLL